MHFPLGWFRRTAGVSNSSWILPDRRHQLVYEGGMSPDLENHSHQDSKWVLANENRFSCSHIDNGSLWRYLFHCRFRGQLHQRQYPGCSMVSGTMIPSFQDSSSEWIPPDFEPEYPLFMPFYWFSSRRQHIIQIRNFYGPRDNPSTPSTSRNEILLFLSLPDFASYTHPHFYFQVPTLSIRWFDW